MNEIYIGDQFPQDAPYSINESFVGSQVSEAMKWLGYKSIKYRGVENGQDPVDGFDCSGFVKFVLERTGVELPEGLRHTNEFFDTFGASVHWGLHKRGDLVFFSYNGGASPSHMGIVLNDRTYIHAPGKDGEFVKISSLTQSPILNLSENAIYNVNPIGLKRITTADGRWRKFS